MSGKYENLRGYLECLTPVILNRLYSDPTPCLAVFRELSYLAKLYVMRMLFINEPISQNVVLSWLQVAHQNDHGDAIKSLSGLGLLIEKVYGLKSWSLNGVFSEGLKIALRGGLNMETLDDCLSDTEPLKDIRFLDNYALERWECVLQFMVGSANEKLSEDVLYILEKAELIKRCSQSHNNIKAFKQSTGAFTQITRKGFQFLLQDTCSQVWLFLIHYLDSASERSIDIVPLLLLILKLNFATPGNRYSSVSLDDRQRSFLQNLREFGMVYQRKRKSGIYYPTRLAINLVSGAKEQIQRSGYLVIETNFRIYAYTTSALQVSLLGLFTTLLYRFPNLVVAILTRESVHNAYAFGVTAKQILQFLNANAHSECGKIPVPSTVSDQIRLWEMETSRISFTDGVLYNQFVTALDFDLLKNRANDGESLIYSNNNKRVMVVSKYGHDDIKKFYKKCKKETEAIVVSAK